MVGLYGWLCKCNPLSRGHLGRCLRFLDFHIPLLASFLSLRSFLLLVLLLRLFRLLPLCLLVSCCFRCIDQREESLCMIVRFESSTVGLRTVLKV